MAGRERGQPQHAGHGARAGQMLPSTYP